MTLGLVIFFGLSITTPALAGDITRFSVTRTIGSHVETIVGRAKATTYELTRKGPKKKKSKTISEAEFTAIASRISDFLTTEKGTKATGPCENRFEMELLRQDEVIRAARCFALEGDAFNPLYFDLNRLVVDDKK